MSTWKFSPLEFEDEGATAVKIEEQCRPDQPGELEQLQ